MEINKIANLLNLEHVKFLISIFKENNIEIRLVGGCIRDALLEREIKDIDTATTLEPQDVLSSLKENNIEYDDFAIQYGSIIAYPHNRKIQITTLREDVIKWEDIQMLFTPTAGKKIQPEEILLSMLYMSETIINYMIITMANQI